MTTIPQDLIERLKRSRSSDNALDMEVEIATFRPDAKYAAVRANNAGTKLIYTTHEGIDETCWAWDWTQNAANRAAAVEAATAIRSLPIEQEAGE